MALTAREEKRLLAVERALNDMLQVLNGTGSTNQLNRVYILLDRELKRIERTMDSLDEKADEVLTLARKLQ